MKLKTTEKGFTLVELLVALSIAAFVTAAASMTIITMMRLTPKTNNWAIALRQVQDAGYWISRDVLMSQTIVVGSGFTYLTLTQPQSTPPAKTVVYQFQAMSGGQRLLRNDGTNTIMIAEYISIPAPPDYNPTSRTLTFSITATSGNVPVTRQYEATQRVPAAPP
jgi:prepilin-type N-terminal cleavage/methylation domain-containing protein